MLQHKQTNLANHMLLNSSSVHDNNVSLKLLHLVVYETRNSEHFKCQELFVYMKKLFQMSSTPPRKIDVVTTVGETEDLCAI